MESHVIASENQKCSERLFYAVVLLLLHSVNSEKQKQKTKKNTINQVAYKQPNFIPHTFENWKSKTKVLGGSVSGEGLLLDS